MNHLHKLHFINTSVVGYNDKVRTYHRTNTLLDFGTLGREDNELIDFTMFPNPTSDVLRFNSDETIVAYKITDISGKLIQSKAIEVSEIDVSRLSANMYFLTVTTQSGIKHTEKFIKK